MIWILLGLLISIGLTVTTPTGQKLLTKIFPMSLKETISKWKPVVDRFVFTIPYAPESRLALAIIYQESKGNDKAVNSKSEATGLMQITKPALTDFNKATGLNYSMSDMLSGEKNIHVGIWYYAWLKENYGLGTPANLSEMQLLQAYNWGIGNVLKYEKNIPLETKQYPNLVYNHYADIINLT